ncbi:hypothetical protein CHS0354_009422 [Potamilus streckersoni]|uniref:Uncharacterized protein n=1 Tax=Potamilus streckersoni TaxID=2493646 RepID=A0AAE0T440_9BIVA|nr:hypothetical protein CHS0354_009422 [Potamilus streckersoni]
MAEAQTLRCIEVLNKMKTLGSDQRPKTQDKLKNVLSKECRVNYISSALSAALSTDKNVCLGETSKVYVQDTELEPMVWNTAISHAKDNGRNLHVLPCDSNLHEKLREQVKEWVDTGRNHVLVDPAATAAQCFIVDEDLDPQLLIDGLQKVGFLQVAYENYVSFKLPTGIAQMEVKRSLEEYRNHMANSFADYTVKGRYYFAKILSESNERIKHDYLEKVELYCEEQFANQYPMFYKERTEEQIRLKCMELLRIDNKTDQFSASLDIPQEMTEENWTILPLYLTPEVAEATLFLCGLSTKPETLFNLRICLEPICKITYVASPKCTLSSFSKNTKLQPKDFHLSDVNIFIGETCDKESIKLTDGDKLSSYIRISSKAQKKYGLLPNTQSGQSHIIPMDTGDAESELKGPGFENLKNFQKYVLEQAKIRSRKQRASLVFNNEQAAIKCKSDLFEWIQNKTEDITDDHFITSKELTDKLIYLGLHFDRMPVDTVVKNLEECGYIKISDSKVTYMNSDVRKLQDAITKNEEEFLQTFQHCYKASATNDHTTFTNGRKRAPGCMLPYGRNKIPKTENAINI